MASTASLMHRGHLWHFKRTWPQHMADRLALAVGGLRHAVAGDDELLGWSRVRGANSTAQQPAGFRAA